MKNKEFLLWEKDFEDCCTQCLWKDGIYSVTVKVGEKTKTASFDQTEEPTFGTMNPKDYVASTALARKIIQEMDTSQET